MSEKTKKTKNYMDIWKETKTVFIPIEGHGEAKTQIVAINGRKFFVPKNKAVEVPMPVANVIERSRKQKEINEREAERDFDPGKRAFVNELRTM